MKTVEVSGMKRPVCANCFEYPENCKGCEWFRCRVCKEQLSESEAYEYRGAYACAQHLEEATESRDHERAEVIQEVDHAIESQRNGEWSNGGYKTMKVGKDGKPITKIKEPLRLQEYENR